MTTGHKNHGSSFSGEMSSLNIDVPEFVGNFSSMNYLQLANAKEAVEGSLNHLFTLLQDTYRFDMSLPLVIDGFPRNDVDVVTVRLIRSKINRLRNDHTKIIEHIQTHLSRQLDASTTSLEAGNRTQIVAATYMNLNPQTQPFALVKDVVTGSPAAKAGLLVGDKIITLDGDINTLNNNNLTAVATRVKGRINIAMPVEVLRGTNLIKLLLTPSDDWPGRGLLGCHIVPI